MATEDTRVWTLETLTDGWGNAAGLHHAAGPAIVENERVVPEATAEKLRAEWDESEAEWLRAWKMRLDEMKALRAHATALGDVLRTLENVLSAPSVDASAKGLHDVILSALGLVRAALSDSDSNTED